MKNKSLKIFSFILALLLICMSSLSISAAEIEPEIDDPIDETPYENCYFCWPSFSISSSGEATVCVSYSGNPDTFTHIKSTIKIQKQVFLFIWSDVPVNENNQWVDDESSISGTIIHTYNLTNTGTYRAIFDIEVYGTGNVTDNIDETLQDTY